VISPPNEVRGTIVGGPKKMLVKKKPKHQKGTGLAGGKREQRAPSSLWKRRKTPGKGPEKSQTLASKKKNHRRNQVNAPAENLDGQSSPKERSGKKQKRAWFRGWSSWSARGVGGHLGGAASPSSPGCDNSHWFLSKRKNRKRVTNRP